MLNINFVTSITYSCNRNAECGCSKTDASLNKIVGGESAVNSSWGWSVSLQKYGQHFCGGAIISPLHIITAAHCVKNPSDIIQYAKVVVGIDVVNQASLPIAQVRSVISVLSHSQYNDESKANDIAVLRLNQPLNISYEKGTARLCLPNVIPQNASNNYPTPNSPLVAIGWGTLFSGETSIPGTRHLQQVTLNGMPAGHSMCKPTINNINLQFCAAVVGGGKGKIILINFFVSIFLIYIVLLDTCQGDSGGPLMHFDSNKRQWILAGITSYGRGCGLPSDAGVYTRASMYNSWLRSIVTDHFVEVPVNSTSLNSTGSSTVSSSDSSTGSSSGSSTVSSSDSSTGSSSSNSIGSSYCRSILSSYWSLIGLLIYVLVQK